MAIEFRCQQCDQLLRVGDASAGTHARCPNCGQVQSVPSQPTPPAFGTGASGLPSSGPHAPTPINPYDAPQPQPGFPTAYPRDQYSRAAAKSKAMPPAIAMLIVAALSAIFLVLILIAGFVDMADNGAQEDDIGAMVMITIMLCMEAVIIYGSIRMMMLKSYPLALVAAMANIVCGLGCCYTLPFGIWALIVLLDAGVSSQFT